MKNIKKLSLLLVLTGISLTACNSGSLTTSSNSMHSNTLTNNSEVELSYLSMSNIPKSALECVQNGQLTFDIGAINNNGMIAGNVNSKSQAGCTSQAFMWSIGQEQMNLLPRTVGKDGSEYELSRINALSSNNITAGFIRELWAPQLLSIMRYYIDNVAYEVIADNGISYNFTNAISENGRYIVGYKSGLYLANIHNGLVAVDTTTHEVINNFQYNNKLVDAIVPYSVTNDGLVTAVILTDDADTSVSCNISTRNCTALLNDTDSMFITSSNGKYTYGLVYGGNYDYGTYQLDINNHNELTKLPIDEILEPSATSGIKVTDSGSLLLDSYSGSPISIYVSQNQKIYKLHDLIVKLGLDDKITSDTRITISPDGHYMVLLGYKDYLAVKVKFNNGIEDYLINNL